MRRVDVSIDGGRTYKEAQLQQPVLPYAHTRFRFAWEWNGEEAVLQSRCTDERGEVQPTIAEAAKILGVTPEYFLQAEPIGWGQPQAKRKSRRATPRSRLWGRNCRPVVAR